MHPSKPQDATLDGGLVCSPPLECPCAPSCFLKTYHPKKTYQHFENPIENTRTLVTKTYVHLFSPPTWVPRVSLNGFGTLKNWGGSSQNPPIVVNLLASAQNVNLVCCVATGDAASNVGGYADHTASGGAPKSFIAWHTSQ